MACYSFHHMFVSFSFIPHSLSFLMIPIVMSFPQLISVSPDELRFQFELEKQTFCDLRVLNNTENHVAFKVKTTSPKKYFVRPNTGVIQPWDSCIIRVTLQAQHEYPPDMQCKDKFLVQSTIVNPNTDVDDLPPDTFNKDSGNSIEELKLRVSYVSSTSPDGSSEDDASKNSAQKLDASSGQALQHLKEERDAAARQTRQLQQELDMLKRQRNRSGPGFSLTFAIFVGLIGALLGFLLKLLFSSPSTE
ncbi:vesicle-associated protein 2-1-like [Abrus precatorius]|uniref:Vesicle-associated protein 2-1-like n=1 Tax=Abrus precatorius TaxID=3816 RepID=A0A8B8M296_ABRPR|nr:vesicle-associated protein 2-1-like [Abrus precatorius]